MSRFEAALLETARQFELASASVGGRSLATIATAIVNRGSFFDALRRGGTCSVRNFERCIDFFSQPSNWPGGYIPADVARRLSETLIAKTIGSGSNVADHRALRLTVTLPPTGSDAAHD